MLSLQNLLTTVILVLKSSKTILHELLTTTVKPKLNTYHLFTFLSK